jgi:hypothetical protein
MRIQLAGTRAAVAAGLLVIGAALISTQSAVAEPAGESRYLANNLRCSFPKQIFGESRAKGDPVEHRLDLEGGLAPIRANLGRSDLIVLWHNKFYSEVSTGLWSYGNGPSGSVQSGSLGMGCE